MELILTDSLRIPLPDDSTERNELGNKLWTAAVILNGVLRAEPELVAGKTVLEIGAGLGACGFCSAALGAKSITLADCGEKTLLQITETLQEYVKAQQHDRVEEETMKGGANLVWDAMNVSIRRHLWEEDLEFVQAKEEHRPRDCIHHWSKNGNTYQQIPTLAVDETFDVVMASDVLYFSSQEIPLLATIVLHLRKNGGVFIMLQTMRTINVSVFARFLVAAQQQFQVTVRDIFPSDTEGGEAGLPQQQQGVNETRSTMGYKLVTMQWPTSH